MSTTHRNAGDDGFERELRSGLATLATHAPAGPSADAVLTALRRRTLLRRVATGGAALAMAAMLALVIIIQQQPSASDPGLPLVRGAENDAPAAPTVDPSPDAFVPLVASVDVRHPSARPPIGDDAANLVSTWPDYPAILTLAAAPVAPPAAPEAINWDLSLSLSLAPLAGDDHRPLISISSPW